VGSDRPRVYNPRKIFYLTIARSRKCVVVLCSALKPVLYATCIVPVQMHFGELENIGVTTIRHSSIYVVSPNVRRWYISKLSPLHRQHTFISCTGRVA
jgi:hypothetical protein